MSTPLNPFYKKIKRGEIKMKKLQCPLIKLRQLVLAIFIYLAIVGAILFTILRIKTKI
jgi:hypothetical protein